MLWIRNRLKVIFVLFPPCSTKAWHITTKRILSPGFHSFKDVQEFAGVGEFFLKKSLLFQDSFSHFLIWFVMFWLLIFGRYTDRFAQSFMSMLPTIASAILSTILLTVSLQSLQVPASVKNTFCNVMCRKRGCFPRKETWDKKTKTKQTQKTKVEF